MPVSKHPSDADDAEEVIRLYTASYVLRLLARHLMTDELGLSDSVYVGLLKAAELHGATHQAVMEFQIVTDKQLKRIRAGRSAIAFYYRKDLNEVASGIEEHKTDTGRMKVSCRELTMLDLLRYPHAAGGIDHVATVLSDLGDRIDGARLAALSGAFERSVVQRLGHLLDRLGHQESTSALYEAVLQGSDLPWVELDPQQASDADFAPPPTQRDDRWRVTVAARRSPTRRPAASTSRLLRLASSRRGIQSPRRRH